MNKATTLRMAALGINPRTLPHRQRCKNCRGAETVEYSFELIAGKWVVWCGCGESSNARTNLADAIKDWNRNHT